MFKPGDIVVCVNDQGSPFIKDAHYKITEITPETEEDSALCTVENVSGWYYLTRFISRSFVPPQKGPPTYSCVGAGGGASNPVDVVHGSNGETHMSSGGPYIASSVYNELEQKYRKAIDSLLPTQLELERVKAAYANRHKELTDMQTRIKELEEQIAAANKPKYTPPPYIKSGWWIAMDADGEWWVYEKKPTVDMQCLEWSYGGSAHELPIITGTDESMWHVPNDQWQQTLLQIP